MLNSVEHEKSIIISGPGFEPQKYKIMYNVDSDLAL